MQLLLIYADSASIAYEKLSLQFLIKGASFCTVNLIIGTSLSSYNIKFRHYIKSVKTFCYKQEVVRRTHGYYKQ